MKTILSFIALIVLCFMVPVVHSRWQEVPIPSSNRWTSGTGPTTLPSSATTVTKQTTLLQLLRCSNSTASAQTITITDLTSGKDLETGFSLPANSDVTFINNAIGVLVGGFQWSSNSSTAINCYASGTQAP